jgi:hypothetical protein
MRITRGIRQCQQEIHQIFIGLRVGQIVRMVFILKTTNFVVGRVLSFQLV